MSFTINMVSIKTTTYLFPICEFVHLNIEIKDSNFVRIAASQQSRHFHPSAFPVAGTACKSSCVQGKSALVVRFHPLSEAAGELHGFISGRLL